MSILTLDRVQFLHMANTRKTELVDQYRSCSRQIRNIEHDIGSLHQLAQVYGPDDARHLSKKIDTHDTMGQHLLSEIARLENERDLIKKKSIIIRENAKNIVVFVSRLHDTPKIDLSLHELSLFTHETHDV